MGFTWRDWGRVSVVVFSVVACVSYADRAAWAKESMSSDSESKVDDDEKSDAQLMYEAMKKSKDDSAADAAIDRAIARAEKDSEKERKALHTQGMAARVWKDPFVDGAAIPVRPRRTARNDSDELRAARAETARARRATLMARADAALARAETARARADAARAEAVAARADAMAARQACVALPGRDPSPRSSSHRSYVARQQRHYSVVGRATPPVEAPRRTITPAALTVPTRPLAAASASSGHANSGIIVVPIPPPDAP